MSAHRRVVSAATAVATAGLAVAALAGCGIAGRGPAAPVALIVSTPSAAPGTPPSGAPSAVIPSAVIPSAVIASVAPTVTTTRRAAKPTASKPPHAATPTKQRARPVNLAARLSSVPASTSQVVIVHAGTSRTTHATLETYRRAGGGWVRQFAPMAARIGADGFSDHHRESVPNTPVGVFGFGATVYGVNSDPGVSFRYHRLVAGDWWNENPDSSLYNTFEHTTSDPGRASEALWTEKVAYQYFAVIDYNVPAVAGAGSGIFLHVGTGGPTAGCVSVARSDLIRVLTWLDPSRHPKIVISPDAELHRF